MAAEEKRLKAQKLVTDVKTQRDERPQSTDMNSNAAIKIQKMFRRTATQRAVTFQTNWKV